MNREHSFQQLTLPALVNGEISRINLSSFEGRWTLFCLPPKFSLVEALFLDQQSLQFTGEGADLVGLFVNSSPFSLPWMGALNKLRYPLVADVQGEIAKTFRLSELNNQVKSQCLLFDDKGFLRCHLVHEFDGRGMAYVFEMLRHYQNQTVMVGHHLDREQSSRVRIRPIPFQNQTKSASSKFGGRTHEKGCQSGKESAHQIAGL